MPPGVDTRYDDGHAAAMLVSPRHDALQTPCVLRCRDGYASRFTPRYAMLMLTPFRRRYFRALPPMLMLI